MRRVRLASAGDGRTEQLDNLMWPRCPLLYAAEVNLRLGRLYGGRAQCFGGGVGEVPTGGVDDFGKGLVSAHGGGQIIAGQPLSQLGNGAEPSKSIRIIQCGLEIRGDGRWANSPSSAASNIQVSLKLD